MSAKTIGCGAFIRTTYVFKRLFGAHHVINAPCLVSILGFELGEVFLLRFLRHEGMIKLYSRQFSEAIEGAWLTNSTKRYWVLAMIFKSFFFLKVWAQAMIRSEWNTFVSLCYLHKSFNVESEKFWSKGSPRNRMKLCYKTFEVISNKVSRRQLVFFNHTYVKYLTPCHSFWKLKSSWANSHSLLYRTTV